MGNASKLRRVEELFSMGTALDLGGEKVWVAKPNTFDRDEAQKDARSARAKAMLAFDRDPDQQGVLETVMSQSSDQELIDAIVDDHNITHLNLAQDEVRTEEVWAERIEAMNNPAAGVRTPEDEVFVVTLSHEFEREVFARKDKRDQELRGDLEREDRGELEVRYRKQYRNTLGANAFYAQRLWTELYRAVRDCAGTITDEGVWSHKECGGHRERLFSNPAEVAECPEDLYEQLRLAFRTAEMSEAEAGNSDAPTASSGSLEQPSKAEDSTPSTPTETSPSPAGI